jgi:hypothetical protein
VKDSVLLSIKYSAILATIICCYFNFRQTYCAIFTRSTVIDQTPMPCAGVCGLPIIAVQLIGAAYFQAAGGKKKLLTLSKQGFFLIPLVLILPNF